MIFDIVSEIVADLVSAAARAAVQGIAAVLWGAAQWIACSLWQLRPRSRPGQMNPAPPVFVTLQSFGAP
jgi:hypothetical protein